MKVIGPDIREEIQVNYHNNIFGILRELYNIVQNNKNNKVSAYREHEIILYTLLLNKWDQKLDFMIPKIKYFFQITPRIMDESINTSEIPEGDIYEAVRNTSNIYIHI